MTFRRNLPRPDIHHSDLTKRIYNGIIRDTRKLLEKHTEKSQTN